MNTYPITEQDEKRMNNNFSYHAPKEGQQEKYTQIREDAKGLSAVLVNLCPPSRELSLALTSLEETVMWANAAIARNE